MGAFFTTNIECFSSIENYLTKYPNQTIYNITKQGTSLNKIEKEKISLLFSSKEITHNSFINVEFKENIPLENIVNIVLFNIYN